MDLPRHLLPDPASARHLFLRAPVPLPLGPLAQDPQAIRAFRRRPQALAIALRRCLRDYAAAGPDARALPILLLAARLGVPAPALLPALDRRRARFEAAFARTQSARQQAFHAEQIRALDALAQALATGKSPGSAADAVAFGCRAAFPAAWAARDVLTSFGLPHALVPDPNADPEEHAAVTGHARLHIASTVAAVAALPDLQRRLRQARDARRRRCLLAAAALCVLHDVPAPEAIRPLLLKAMADLPARDRSLLERAAP